ncbi:DUF2325 domain-containing protein [Romboutsia maritimum]|uniref:DUF2325 domain-containing protein n=1 Tax=Romboutsia maritimum TaxID=2020948 RepID=A0A371IRD2_9FIRM|nr:DUF2325 domain-containing protein [Romboutsia maritimum]RDY23035.1 DUF2325 domain-containing protein [Romboutsia maritimum]
MNLVVVGGNEKMKRDYISLGKERGYKTKVFSNMSSKMNKSMGNPDAIVIFTSAVSHKMTIAAETHAKKLDIPIIRHKSSSKFAFNQCLEKIDECTGNCKDCKYNKLEKI